MAKPVLSIFDMDGTLFPFNVSYQFGLFLEKKSYFSFSSRLRMLAYYIVYKMGYYSINDLHTSSFDFFLKDKCIDDLSENARVFIDSYLLDKKYQPSIEKFLEAKSKGHTTILISSSAQFLVNEVGSKLGFDYCVGTSYERSHDGKLVALKNIIDGQQKLNFVASLVKDQGYCLSSSFFYTDSIVDMPLIESVGNPVAVNPEKSLRRYALANNILII